ncbi:hypothetical protein [Arhodomonas sp. SL1]|uniref:hypothetical protein n=1 Tax=Arhodomonas sp. SL1 TaxID=3425691 RepID=UPI003F8830F0
MVLSGALVLASALPAPATAIIGGPEYETRVVISGRSWHIGLDTEYAAMDFREWNTGIGMEWVRDDGYYATAGSYQDSYGADAYYAGIGRRWPLYEAGPAQLAAGAMISVHYRAMRWAYDGAPGARKLVPIPTPVVTARYGAVALNLMAIPSDSPGGYGVIAAAQVTISLSDFL